MAALQLEQKNPKAGVKPYDIPVAPLLLTAAAPWPANHHPVDQLTSQMQRELHAMRCRLGPQRSDNGGPGAVVPVGLVLANHMQCEMHGRLCCKAPKRNIGVPGVVALGALLLANQMQRVLRMRPCCLFLRQCWQARLGGCELCAGHIDALRILGAEWPEFSGMYGLCWPSRRGLCEGASKCWK